MLRRRPLLQVIIIFLFSISLISAQYSVKGIVKDKNGAPVIGALVDLGTGENSAFTNAQANSPYLTLVMAAIP